jgi:cob(I)alamin adenosyltransferase
MADTVHNWDIEVLSNLKGEMQKLRDTLSENREMLISKAFDIMVNMNGKAARKAVEVTATRADELDNIIDRYDELIKTLDNVIVRCYTPCEEEIKAKVRQLI